MGQGGAPAPAGPYRAAVRHGDLLFCSGQIALDPESGEMVRDGSAAEMRQCMENLAAVCAEHGTDLRRALRLTIYTTQMGNLRSSTRSMRASLPATYRRAPRSV